MDLFFRKIGDRGFPMIILHGLYGSSDNWFHIGNVLSSHYTVYLVDQRNHGRSGHADVHNYRAMAGDLFHFFRLMKIEKANIIGHSMGGKTAMFFSLFYPDLANKLLIADISPKSYSDDKVSAEHAAILDKLGRFRFDGLKTYREVDGKLSSLITDPRLRGFLLKGVKRDIAGNFGWRFNLPVLRNELPSVLEGIDESSKINVPALFIRGGLSDHIRDCDKDLIARIFPRSEIATIPNATHWVHAEQPEIFMKLADNFFNE